MHIYQFYQHLYMKKQNISEDSTCNFLNDLTVPSLTTEQSLSCEGNLTEKEIYNSLISLENNKSPGNDGFTKEFYYTSGDDIKDTFMKSLKRLNIFALHSDRQLLNFLKNQIKIKDIFLIGDLFHC